MQTIIHFYANTQQRETALVLAQVLKKFLVVASNVGLKTQVLHKILGSENNSIQEAYVLIQGTNRHDFLKNWIGTIRWVGQSKFSKIEKETHWHIGAEIWKENADFNFLLSDVSFQAIRSGGPGGQHVNKVSTAVRATHEPTGIQVSASDSRSQSKNKELALQRLEEKVLEHQMSQVLAQLKSSSKMPKPLQENRPVKTFRGTDFKKESSKKPIKKERQRSKIEIKKRYYNDND